MKIGWNTSPTVRRCSKGIAIKIEWKNCPTVRRSSNGITIRIGCNSNTVVRT